MFGYVLIAGLLGWIPGVSYILIAIEAWMIHSIAHGYGIDNFGELVWFIAGAAALSGALKTIAHLVHFAPIVGQIANSLVAIAFVVALYHIADSHYAHLAQIGKHPDTLQQTPFSQ